MFSDNAVCLQSPVSGCTGNECVLCFYGCSTYQKVCAKDIVLEAKSE